jgi:hypothetical protein
MVIFWMKLGVCGGVCNGLLPSCLGLPLHHGAIKNSALMDGCFVACMCLCLELGWTLGRV